MKKYKIIMDEYNLQEYKTVKYKIADKKHYNKLYTKITNQEPIDFSYLIFNDVD